MKEHNNIQLCKVDVGVIRKYKLQYTYKHQYSLKTVDVNMKLLINWGAEKRVAPVKPYEKLCTSPANMWGWYKRSLYSKRTTWKHVWSLSLTCPWDQLCFKKRTQKKSYKYLTVYSKIMAKQEYFINILLILCMDVHFATSSCQCSNTHY